MRNEREQIPFDTLQRVVLLGTDSLVEESSTVPIGQVNEVYDVKLENGQEVIVRVSRRGGDILEHERWALDACRAVGVPTPLTLAIEHLGEETAVTVQEKLEGVRLSEVPESERQSALVKIGEVISRIHQVRTNGFGWTSPNGEGMFQTWEQFIGKALSKTQRLQDIALRNGIDPEIFTRALNFIDTHKGIYTGDARLVHRDLGPDHFLIKDGEVSGVIDFENCIGGDPLYDLARWELLYRKQFPTDEVMKGYIDPSLENYDLRNRLYIIHAAISVIDYMQTVNRIQEIHLLATQLKDKS